MRALKRSNRRVIATVAAAIFICAMSFLGDNAVQRWIELHQNAHLLGWMQKVSRWGDWPLHVALGLASAGIAYACGSRRWVRIFLAMVLACALAGSIARVVKIGTGRSRPSVQTEAGWNGPRLHSKYNAFPSGHVAASTAFFAVLAFATWRIGSAFLLIPALIAFSRMYVGAHHLSDVVCAAVLGLGAAWIPARTLLGKTAPEAVGDKA